MSSHRSLPIARDSALLAAACTLTCTVVVLACSESSISAAAWEGVVRDSAGIEVVENFGTPLWREGEGWEFTEVLRIGTVEGEPEYEFGEITGLTILSDRRIVAADGMAHHLRFFSADGVYEQTVGTQGKGPGEFGDGVLRVLPGPGDTLLVQDDSNAQMHAFGPDGTWLGSFSTLPGEGYYYTGWDSDAATGRIVSGLAPLLGPDRPPADTLDLVLARDVRGAVLDTVARVPSSQTFAREGDATLRYYYRGHMDYVLCGDGLVAGRSDEYRLLWYGPQGTVDRVFSLPWEPLPLTAEDQSVITRRWEEVFQEYQVPLERAAAIKSTFRYESSYPAFRRIICGPAGTVIVQHVRPLRDLTANEQKQWSPWWTGPRGSAEWDVFDDEGRYLGVATLPGTDLILGRVPRFVRDAETGTWYMYTVWSDEQDVQYVIGWRIDGDFPE